MIYTVLLIIIAVIAYGCGSMSSVVIASNFVFHVNLRRLGTGSSALSNFRRIYGVKGFVTDALCAVDYDYFFTCGPEPMFRALEKTVKTSGQFSFEQRMGCGFGACMGCTCKTLTGNKRICREGPVLFREEIIW